MIDCQSLRLHFVENDIDGSFPKGKYQHPLFPYRAILIPAGQLTYHVYQRINILQIGDMPLDFSCIDKYMSVSDEG